MLRRAIYPLVAAALLLRENWPWLLVLSFLVLLPAKNLFNIPVLLMAAGGAVVAVRKTGRLRQDPALKALFLLFLCVWLPMAFSLPDAVNIGHSGTTTLKYLRFPLMGIFVVWALRRARAQRQLLIGASCVLALWCADALWQWAAGADFFGYPLHPVRLQGIFYPRWSLGIVLAVLAPLYFEGVRLLAVRVHGGWILALPLCLVVVLSGSRTGWIVLAAAVCGYLAYLIWWLRARAMTRPHLLAAALLLAATGIIAWQYPGVGTRIQATQGLLGGGLEVLDAGTARRVSIWRPAVAVAGAHWINGVGPRGFRYVFADYAEPGNFWFRDGNRGATHPHLQWLEIAVETGGIGVLGLLLMIVLLFRLARSVAPECRGPLIPWLLPVMLALFPLNAHKAFYGSFWASITWWLVFLFLSAGAAARSAENGGRAPGSNPRRP